MDLGRASFGGARPTPPVVMMENQEAARLEAIRAEREVYAARGLVERVAACDAEIARLTGRPSAPAHQSRAVRRPRVDVERETR